MVTRLVFVILRDKILRSRVHLGQTDHDEFRLSPPAGLSYRWGVRWQAGR